MKSVCVFVGANRGLRPIYENSAIALAKEIAKRKLKLIYGGANVGLMGRLANTALECGADVIGVIPQSLVDKEIAHRNLTTLHIVKSMQDRKSMMTALSNSFIALPGGLGTLEEVFEIWNGIKMGLHKKPLGLLNVDGYFDPLLNFLKYVATEGFVKKEQLDLVIISDCPGTLLNKINSIAVSSKERQTSHDRITFSTGHI